jgi:hypothetical protein
MMHDIYKLRCYSPQVTVCVASTAMASRATTTATITVPATQMPKVVIVGQDATSEADITGTCNFVPSRSLTSKGKHACGCG